MWAKGIDKRLLVILGVVVILFVIATTSSMRSQYMDARWSGVLKRESAPVSQEAIRRMTACSVAPAPAMPAEALGSVLRGGARGNGNAALAAVDVSQPDRYLIKTGTLTIEVQDAKTAADKLVATLQPLQGYVSSLNERLDVMGRRSVTMQVRVPADKFDQAALQIESLGRVLTKQVTSEDVTEQYVDTESRARNLKATEERLLDHLKQSGKLEDVLSIERELTRVRGEIEQLEGKLRFLKDRTSYSTISVTLQEAPQAEPITPVETFSSAKVFSESVRSMLGFLQGIWTWILRIAAWSPVSLAILAAAWYVRRRLKRMHARV